MITVVLSEEYCMGGDSGGKHAEDDDDDGNQNDGDLDMCTTTTSFEVFDQPDLGSLCLSQDDGSFEENCCYYSENGGQLPPSEERQEDGSERRCEGEGEDEDNDSDALALPPLSPLSVTDDFFASTNTRSRRWMPPRRGFMHIESMRRYVHFADHHQVVTTPRYSIPERRATWYRRSELKFFRKDVERTVSDLDIDKTNHKKSINMSTNKEEEGSMLHYREDDSLPCVSSELELFCLALARTLHKLTAQAIVLEQQQRQHHHQGNKVDLQTPYHDYCRKSRLTQWIDTLVLRREHWKAKRRSERKVLVQENRIAPRYFCYVIQEENLKLTTGAEENNKRAL